MSYYEEESIRRRVVQRIRRRFLLALHILVTLGIAAGHIYTVHSNAVWLQNSRPVTDYWVVGGYMYWTHIIQVVGILGAILLLHLLYFAYREVLTRALSREMTQAYSRNTVNEQVYSDMRRDKQKRAESLMLSDDGELIEQIDYPPELKKQWQGSE
jgi:hypothetical protein